MSLGSWFTQRFNDAQPDAAAAHSLMTDLQQMFLTRLERLAGLRDNAQVWEQLSDAGQELLRWSIYSSYCDCVDAGVGSAARTILHPPAPAGSSAAPGGALRDR